MRKFALVFLCTYLGLISIWLYIGIIAYFVFECRELFGIEIAGNLTKATMMIPLALFFNLFSVVCYKQYKSNKK